MRILCLISGGCHFQTLREEWLPPDKHYQYSRLYRVDECPWCHDTRATITSPEPDETRTTLPRRFLDNGRSEVKA